jgi:hypothetical protein
MLADCNADFRSSAAYLGYPIVLYGYGSSKSALIPAQIPAISFDTPAPMVWNRMHESAIFLYIGSIVAAPPVPTF